VDDNFHSELNSNLVSKLSYHVEEAGGRFVLASSVMAAFPSVSNYARARYECEIALAKRNAVVLRIAAIPDSSLDPAIASIHRVGEILSILPVPRGKVWVTESGQIRRAIDSLDLDFATGTYALVTRREDLISVVRRSFSQHRIRAFLFPAPKFLFRFAFWTITKMSRFFGITTRFTPATISTVGIKLETASIFPLVSD
jgi:hypothetical protein